MIAFLRTLGMAPVVTTVGGTFAEMVAGGGAASWCTQWWQALSAPGAGTIGLHAPGGEDDRVSRPSGTEFGDIALVRLGFETAEDLDALAARLRNAGHDARVVEDEVRSVHVTDPDGKRLEIHPRT